MSKLKLVQGLWVPALLICITAGMITPSHAADNVQFVGAGSSAMWQNMALAAYNSGKCVAGAGATAPCFHYTAKGFRLVDQRSSTIGLETGNIWVVWDSNTTSRNVWMYVNVDSVVGNRCYFAQPHCLAEAPSTGIPAPGNLITLTGTIWGGSAADTALPADVQSVLTTGIATTAAMTDIRPEDAFYAECRANTSLDTTNEKKGLGYNTNNLYNKLAGDIYCPPNVTSGTSFPTLIGTSIGNPFTTTVAQVIAFNISGTDPFPPNTAIPAYTVVSVGAAPIVFITRRTGTLKSQLTATDTQVYCAFTTPGAAGCFGSNTAIDTFQREPMSGTFNTAEFSVFRNNPFQTNASQEDGVSPPTDNPLKQEVGTACSNGGFTGRYRVIGTGQMVSSVLTSVAPACSTADALGYAFFSFGNVSTIANNASYGYLTLDGLDPIGPGDLLPGNQELPGSPFPAAAGCTGNAFPCDEAHLWNGTTAKLSFPSLRAAGTTSGPPYSANDYRAWSVLRLVSDGTNLTKAKLLVSGAQYAAVCYVPDFVPAVAVNATGTNACSDTTPATAISDPGLKVYRSHYKLQYTTNGTTTTTVNPNNGFVGAEAGRDEGGCVLATPGVGNAGVLNLGQDFFPSTPANNCSTPSFP